MNQKFPEVPEKDAKKRPPAQQAGRGPQGSRRPVGERKSDDIPSAPQLRRRAERYMNRGMEISL